MAWSPAGNIKGPAGPSGPAAAWRGTWAAGVFYAQHDLVHHDGQTWRARSARGVSATAPGDLTHRGNGAFELVEVLPFGETTGKLLAGEWVTLPPTDGYGVLTESGAPYVAVIIDLATAGDVVIETRAVGADWDARGYLFNASDQAIYGSEGGGAGLHPRIPLAAVDGGEGQLALAAGTYVYAHTGNAGATGASEIRVTLSGGATLGGWALVAARGGPGPEGPPGPGGGGGGGISPSVLTAAGDLIVAGAPGEPVNLPAGPEGAVLTIDGAEFNSLVGWKMPMPGPEGPAGPTGPAGPSGAPGPAGPAGEQGPAGNSATVPIEPWTTITTFLNGWTPYGGGAANTPQYRKMPDGRVQMRGLVKGGTANSVIFTLPEGYRPDLGVVYAPSSSRTGSTSWVNGEIRVSANGDVQTQGGSSGQTTAGSYFSLECEFPTGQATFPTGPAGPPGPVGTPPLVTTLPATPSDGEEVSLLVDAATGTIWRMRFRAAAPDMPHRWEFVGGTPLVAEVAAQQATTSTTYVDLTTVGPQLVVPRAGYYRVTIAARMVGPVGQDSFGMASVAAGGTPSDDNALFQQSAGGGTPVAHMQRELTLLAAAGATMKMSYRKSAAGASASFAQRRLQLLPVRIA